MSTEQNLDYLLYYIHKNYGETGVKRELLRQSLFLGLDRRHLYFNLLSLEFAGYLLLVNDHVNITNAGKDFLNKGGYSKLKPEVMEDQKNKEVLVKLNQDIKIEKIASFSWALLFSVAVSGIYYLIHFLGISISL